MLSFAHLVVPAIFLSYLLTLSPTILWRDSPEFANVAFTLSIAHPAGFPTYSLLVKPLTFIPFGSIAFKSNLASAIFALLSVMLLVSALRLLIKRVYPSAPSADVQISCAVASLLFALGPIVWYNATITEVYTLNTLFIAGLIYLILLWLDGFDPRWLFLSAFLYGLSAGNHATVALFLPGLLALYFIKRRRNSCEWIKAILFFLLGISVYLYLPVRSLANPPYDWGDPQNLKNFLYQITDQKDFFVPGGVSAESANAPLNLVFNHLGLITRQFTPVGITLVLLGVVPALRREKGLSLLFSWVIFSNHAFFWAWTSGDAFLPSYLALAFFLAVGSCSLLGFAREWSQATSSRVRELVTIGLCGLIVVHILFTYPKMNKRNYYLPSDFYRPVFTPASIEPEAVLLTHLQWFHLKYFQDVERLRQDISLVLLMEIVDPRGFNPMTPDRHPRLVLPTGRQTSESGLSFLSKFLAENISAGRSIYSDLSVGSYPYFDGKVSPHEDFIFRVSMTPSRKLRPEQISRYLRRIEEKLFKIRAASQTTYDPDLYLYLDDYISILAQYLDSRQHYLEAIHLLRLYLQTYGPEGTKSITDKNVSILYNSLGLSELHRGEMVNGIRSLELAIQYNPQNKDPYLNLALWSLEKAPGRFADALGRARRNGLNPKEICATLEEDLLKEGQTKLLEQAQAFCEKT